MSFETIRSTCKGWSLSRMSSSTSPSDQQPVTDNKRAFTRSALLAWIKVKLNPVTTRFIDHGVTFGSGTEEFGRELYDDPGP
jgi:hypothetical protein